MKPEIQLTAREKRQMMRVLFNESVSLKEAAKIKVRPLCCPTNEELAESYEGDPAYKDPEDEA